MDKAVIDELFEDEDRVSAFRHSDEELRTVLGGSENDAVAIMDRIEAIKDELKDLQAQLAAEADELEDLYDDLDFSQQTLSGGPATDISDTAEEFRNASNELDVAIDALSDMLIFRFK